MGIFHLNRLAQLRDAKTEHIEQEQRLTWAVKNLAARNKLDRV